MPNQETSWTTVPGKTKSKSIVPPKKYSSSNGSAPTMPQAEIKSKESWTFEKYSSKKTFLVYSVSNKTLWQRVQCNERTSSRRRRKRRKTNDDSKSRKTVSSETNKIYEREKLVEQFEFATSFTKCSIETANEENSRKLWSFFLRFRSTSKR